MLEVEAAAVNRRRQWTLRLIEQLKIWQQREKQMQESVGR